MKNYLTFSEKQKSFALFNCAKEGILIENINGAFVLSTDFTTFNAVLFETEASAWNFIEENGFDLEPFRFSEVIEDSIDVK